jgi:hypothetical protein
MPLQNGIHCKEKDKVLLICTMDSNLRRNDFSVLVMPLQTASIVINTNSEFNEFFDTRLLDSNNSKTKISFLPHIKAKQTKENCTFA